MSDGLFTLVLGGARSGKSRHAESLIEAQQAPWFYVVTAISGDSEMKARIAEHQARRGPEWVTIEAPLDLAAALESINKSRPVLIDCVTLWLSNLMMENRDIDAALEVLILSFDGREAHTVVVTNEVGHGIVPENALARKFRDAQGALNQRLAARADRVVMMAAGIPVTIKPVRTS
jgi:adenosyl cobinamide kinase/adenosyl cobinamide phosphate guanylyltransferase